MRASLVRRWLKKRAVKVRHGDENAYATKTILIAVLIKSAAALWEAQGLLISHLPSLTIYMNVVRNPAPVGAAPEIQIKHPA